MGTRRRTRGLLAAYLHIIRTTPIQVGFEVVGAAMLACLPSIAGYGSRVDWGASAHGTP